MYLPGSEATTPTEVPETSSTPREVSPIKVEFRRDLKLFDITMIGIGAMIGAGIFVLIGIAAGLAGPACIIAFLLNGIINCITAMTYAELGSAYPEAGGGYLWIRKGLPPPFGFVSGWISWFGHTVACSLYSLGFGTYAEWLLTEYNLNPLPQDANIGTDKIIAIIVAAIVLYINYRGTASTGKTENLFTVSKLFILGIFIVLGGIALTQNPKAMDNLTGNFFPEGGGGILFAMGITLIAFQGYEVIAQTGEEVQNPKRNIPRAIFISLFVVVVIYILMIVILFGIITTGMLVDPGTGESMLPHEFLANAGESGETALVVIAEAAMGTLGVVLILMGGFLSTLSALNATVFSSSRVAFAMGRDGTLPKRLGAIHSKRRTPHNALAFSGFILIFMILFFPIETVAGSAGVMFLILFAITNAAGISLRYKTPELDRGFKVPLFPVISIIGIILNLALIYPIFLLEPMAFYVGISWIFIGAYIYFFTGAQKEILEAPMVMKEMEEKLVEDEAKRFRVLIPIKEQGQGALVKLGAVLAKAKDGDLSLLHTVEIPKTTPASAVGFRDVQEQLRFMEDMEHLGKKLGLDVDARILISHDIAPTIVDASQKEDIETMIVGWHGLSTIGVIMGTNLDHIIANADSDIIVFKTAGLKSKINNIYMMHGHDWHVSHAAELAAIYAKHHGASITLLSVHQHPGLNDEDKEQNDRLMKIMQEKGVTVQVKNVQHDDIVTGVAFESAKADLLFLGAAEASSFGRNLFGDIPDKIAKLASCPVIILKKVAKDRPLEGIDRVE